MATLHEALSLIDEISRELSFYEDGNYKQLQEQTIINKSKDLLDKAKATIMGKDSDGAYRYDKLSSEDWRKITSLLTPLARCFTLSTPPPVSPTTKTRHGAAMAVATLALLSSCNQESKMIVTKALETGVVDAYVSTLWNSLRNPTTDRVLKAMLYKLVEALWGFTLFASAQHQQEMVAKNVVNVCLDLVTSPSVEMESRLNANKTLYNCLNSSVHVVTHLLSSKVTALNTLLQQLASSVPDPEAAASLGVGTGASSAPKNITMPVLLPAVMSWIWFLPDYILDHLIDSLAKTVGRVVVLVWPEDSPGIGPDEPAPGRDDAPTLVAQNSLPNRCLQKILQNLFKAIAAGIADRRLVDMLRGARLPAPPAPSTPVPGQTATAPDPGNLNAQQALQGTGLPVRLVRVVRKGRPDGQETKVALELLDELFACNDNGGHPELADDAIEAGLLGSMTEMGVLESLRTEAGLAGVSSYVRLTVRLVKRAPYTPGLALRLRDSGVPASVAYVAFWPTGKMSLKLEALQALDEMVRLDQDMTERVVAMNNFPTALSNTLLGGDPEARRPAKKSGGGASKKKGSAAAAAAASAAAAAASDSSAPNSISRNNREQVQNVAFDILTVVLDVAQQSEKVWEIVVESGMLPRLIQHCGSFPMEPELMAELLLAVGLTFKDHRDDVASVGGLQAACAPHLLPLLAYEDQEMVVAAAAAGLLKQILLDMQRYRSSSADVAEGDDILKALVAAGPAIDSANPAGAGHAGTTAAAAATAAPVSAAAAGQARGQVTDGAGGSPGKAGLGGVASAAPRSTSQAGAGPSSAGVKSEEELQRQGPAAMDVDGPSSSAAPRSSAAATASVSTPGPANADDLIRGTNAAARADANGAPSVEPPAEPSQLVDVTAHGLGLICSAVQSCTSALFQPRSGTPASPGLTGGGGHSAPSTASSPRSGAWRGADAAGAGGASRTPAPAPGASEALGALLVSCRLLGEACLQMPSHGPVRRHMARAFAYAKPAAEELVAALQAPPELLCEARELIGVLKKIPVLDVALLPKPKLEEDTEAPAVPANAAARKGRAAGGGKRSSQGNLAPNGGAQPAQQPSKRQRTSSATLASGTDTGQAPMGRTRSTTLNGEGVATGSPRIAARAAAAAAAGPGVSSERREGRGGPRRGSADEQQRVAGSPPTDGRGARGAEDGGGGAGDGDVQGFGYGGRAVGAGALSRAGSESPGAVATGATTADPAMPAQPVCVGVAGGLGLPLPCVPPPVKAPPPNPDSAAALLSENPIQLVKKRASPGPPGSARAGAGQAAAATAPGSATAAGGAGSGSGTEGAAAGKGRVNAAEFRARYLDLKAQNTRMASELEDMKRARDNVQALQVDTAATLSTRTQELERARQELAVRTRERDSARQEVAALRAELQILQEATTAAQAAVAEANKGLRELEQLRAENAELKAELATLEDLE